MVGLAIAVTVGMLTASSGLLKIEIFFLAALFLLFLSVLFFRSRFGSTAVFSVVAMTAACRFMVSVPELRNDSIHHVGDEIVDQQVCIIGRVSGFPEFFSYNRGRLGSWSFPLQCKGLSISSQWQKLSGQIDVRMTYASPDIPVSHGQKVIISGAVGMETFPGGSALELKADDRTNVLILEDAPFWSPVVLGRAWRNRAAKKLQKEMGTFPVQESVLKALVLGFRKEMPAEEMDCFRRTGTLHVFAISGLHVGIVGLFLAIILKTAGVPRDWFGVWLLPLLGIYVISTGMKPSALRAFTMAAVYLLGPLFRRRPDIPSSVAFAAILLLAFRPAEILSAGFIFSFAVVTFIVMVYSKVPRHWIPGGWKSYLPSLFITSAAASLAAIPLSVLYFGTFSPAALVGNLIVVPLTFCIVLCGWLSILLPLASSVFNHAAVVFINLMLGGVRWLDRLPGSSWQMGSPPLLAVALWFGSLIYLFTHASVSWQRRYAFAGISCAILLAVLA